MEHERNGSRDFSSSYEKKQILFLVQNFRFDVLQTQLERKKVDKLAPIRYLFEEFVSNFKSTYTPSEYVTMDEKLDEFRGLCSFNQYSK